MPELPEVETTRCGIAPHLLGQKVNRILVRQRQLRWPVTRGLEKHLLHKEVTSVRRRGKYLLINLDDEMSGTLLIHLGMSGSLRIVEASLPAAKHDHVDVILSNGKGLRYTDPRRFGTIQWIKGDPLQHDLLVNLGPEPVIVEGNPLGDELVLFSADYLYQLSRKRKVAIKQFLMDSKVVVGVGNIYANEALFLAGIRPTVAAGKVSRGRFEVLAGHIQGVLNTAIAAGGTTLRDFVSAEGKPGYFSQALRVYGRGGEGCVRCGEGLKEIRLGQRSTVFCPACQR